MKNTYIHVRATSNTKECLKSMVGGIGGSESDILEKLIFIAKKIEGVKRGELSKEACLIGIDFLFDTDFRKLIEKKE